MFYNMFYKGPFFSLFFPSRDLDDGSVCPFPSVPFDGKIRESVLRRETKTMTGEGTRVSDLLTSPLSGWGSFFLSVNVLGEPSIGEQKVELPSARTRFVSDDPTRENTNRPRPPSHGGRCRGGSLVSQVSYGWNQGSRLKHRPGTIDDPGGNSFIHQ